MTLFGTYKEEQDKADIQLTANMQGFKWEEYPPRPKPTAFEWHNYATGHCYVDYIERPHMGEKEGYIANPLYKIDTVKYI